MKLLITIDNKQYQEQINSKDELIDLVIVYSSVLYPEEDQLFPELFEMRDFDGVAYHIAECYGNKEPYISEGKKYAELLKRLNSIKSIKEAMPILKKIEFICKPYFTVYILSLDLSNDNTYQILDVKYSFKENYAMVPNCIVVSLKITNGITTKWITNINVDGIDGFYLTDKSIFRLVLKEMPSDRTINYLNNNVITVFDDYVLDDNLLDQLKKKPNRILQALHILPKLSEEEAIKALKEIRRIK